MPRMAYPFGWNPPSLGQFIQICTDKFDAELRVLGTEIEGDFGKAKPRVLVRNDGKDERHVVLPNEPNDVLQEARLIAHWCRRLNIPTSEFRFEYDKDTGAIEINDS